MALNLAIRTIVGHVSDAMPNSASPAYATFGRRLQAMTIDAVIVVFGIVAIAMVGDFARDVPGSGRVLVAALYALFFLYEPVLVWRFGTTLGHRTMNLKVVDDATGGPPPFWRASARFVVKSVLGWLSFFAMAFTRRHQAIHDKVTHTTVQIRDLRLAAADDYHVERISDAIDPALPSPLRRSVIILLYTAALYLVGVVAGAVAFAMVGQTDLKVIGDLVAIFWLGGAILIVTAGWRGQLLGARRSRSLPGGQDMPVSH
jgi:uncharacterized RDD family membrane protein YckC